MFLVSFLCEENKTISCLLKEMGAWTAEDTTLTDVIWNVLKPNLPHKGADTAIDMEDKATILKVFGAHYWAVGQVQTWIYTWTQQIQESK